MADTYTAFLPAVSITPGKSLLGIYNDDAVLVVGIRRVHLISCQNSPVQDYYYGTMEMRLASAYQGGRTLDAIKHDSSNPALDTDIKVLSAATWTDTAILRRRLVTLADPNTTLAPVFGEVHPVLACSWEGGYASAAGVGQQVFTLRENEGFHCMMMTMSVSGEFDIAIEFTVA